MGEVGGGRVMDRFVATRSSIFGFWLVFKRLVGI